MDVDFVNCIRNILCITNCSSVYDESDEETTDYIPASCKSAKLRSRHREIWRHGSLLAAL
jgi:ferredoxin